MNVCIIGAGASGLVSAIAAARSGALVTVYEHKESAANKILITGNGKCNFTNLFMKADRFHSSSDNKKWIEGILERFGNADCTCFFESLGIKTRERKGGIYPYSDTAESVKSALLLELRRLQVKVIYNCGKISVSDGGIVNGTEYDRVILACGGMSAKKTGSDGSGYEILRKLGVSLTPLYPALTPLVLKEDLSGIKGVRCEASLALFDEKGNIVDDSYGELQPYESGLSGICAMDISSSACRILGRGRRAFVEADLLPIFSDDEFKREIVSRSERFPDRNLSELLNGLFPKKLINYLVHPIDTRKPAFEDLLVANVKHHRFELSDAMVSDFSRSQTVAGGVPISAVDANCGLIEHERIYVVGELLDVDGVCGGYNLHFAFATGYIAGDCG